MSRGLDLRFRQTAFLLIATIPGLCSPADAISPGGLIAGTANVTGDQTGWRGFTANCH